RREPGRWRIGGGARRGDRPKGPGKGPGRPEGPGGRGRPVLGAAGRILAPGKYCVDTPPPLRDLVGFPHRHHPAIFITMAHSEVLLVKPVDGLGGEGDQVKVRAGYARNYLLPRNVAVPVTKSNRKQIEALKKRRAEREAHELNGAQELAKKLEKTSLAFAVTTGEGG